MPSNNTPVLMVNYSSPELNHFSAALSRSGLLSHYIRPYANKHRGWEKTLSDFPMLGRIYSHTLGRRVMPPGLLREHIVDTALWEDFGRAAWISLGRTFHQSPIAEHLHWRIQRRVAAVAANYAPDAEIVLGNYIVARSSFEHTSGIKVLNYPIAHHRYIQNFVIEESEREPEFAKTLPDWSITPPWVDPHLDAECSMADQILVGSSFTRDSFLAEGLPPENITIIPYGADVSLFTPSSAKEPRKDGFRILFVGQIGQRKGISYLLRAYRAIRGTGTTMTLVGHYNGDPRIFAPFRDYYQHIPNVPRIELARIYRQADVFVFPTLLEGLPLVVLEAMASGLPVITTPNGPSDIVRDGVDGFVVPIRDVDAIVEKMEYLRTHPDQRVRMGKHARERALCFSWAAYQARSIDFIRNLDTDKQRAPTLSPVGRRS